MKEIKCPSCGEMIPGDCKFCDMCGVELLECVSCKTLGTDPFCPECGKPMIARKIEVTQSANNGGDSGEKTVGRPRKTLVLKARKGNLTITPSSDANIGRVDSPYASLLSDMTMISRRHGKFVKRGNDWYIVDFESSNGTYVNDKEIPANTPVKFTVGDVVDIGTYLFDVVEI